MNSLTAFSPTQLDQALLRFGLTEFRPGQRGIIESVLAGHHTIAIMPTGAGKSLCYQLPASMLPGVTLVVSPLIALMKDQVDSLCRRGILATEITSSISDSERNKRLEDARNGEIKLLYIAPERFRSAQFWETLEKLSIDLVAIDEAHCVSQWGHDFRPDYLRLGECIQKINPPRIVALTATATPEVRRDIRRLLGMQKIEPFVHGFDRPNITFNVEQVTANEKLPRVLELLKDLQGGSGIVYVSTRKNAEEYSAELGTHGILAAAYHAGLKDEEREQIQNLFMAGKTNVLVATNAFGMGVDKRDVRVVIHCDAPRALDAYYQEAGRAGRDGKPASCTLLFNLKDIRVQEYLIDGSTPPPEVLRAAWKTLKEDPSLANKEREAELAKKINASNGMQAQSAIRVLMRAGYLTQDPFGVIRTSKPPEGQPPFDPEEPMRRGEREKSKLKQLSLYAYTKGCRRRAILEYFGDASARRLAGGCQNCDNCLSGGRRALTPEEIEQTLSALAVLQKTRGRFGRQKVITILSGGSLEQNYGGIDQIPEYGALRGCSKDQIFALLENLEASGLIETFRGDYPTIGLTFLGKRALRDPSCLDGMPIASSQEPVKSSKSKTTKAVVSSASVASPALQIKLKKLRQTLSKRDQIPEASIFSDKVIQTLSALYPQTPQALLSVPGIGATKARKYGTEIIETILEFQRSSEAS